MAQNTPEEIRQQFQEETSQQQEDELRQRQRITKPGSEGEKSDKTLEQKIKVLETKVGAFEALFLNLRIVGGIRIQVSGNSREGFVINRA